MESVQESAERRVAGYHEARVASPSAKKPPQLGVRRASVVPVLERALVPLIGRFVLVIGMAEHDPEENPEKRFEVVRIFVNNRLGQKEVDRVEEIISYEVIRYLRRRILSAALVNALESTH